MRPPAHRNDYTARLGEVWLDHKIANDWSTRWRLKSTDDGVAFLIKNATSGYALDAGANRKTLRVHICGDLTGQPGNNGSSYGFHSRYAEWSNFLSKLLACT